MHSQYSGIIVLVIRNFFEISIALLMTDEFRDYSDKIGDQYKNVYKSYNTFVTNIHLSKYAV